MIDRHISDCILTIGPSPEMKGGIAQVLSSYFNDVFVNPKFIPETVEGSTIKHVAASAAALVRLIYTLATDKDIRIVHLHTAHKVSFPRSAIFAKIARTMHRKVVIHMHGSNFKEYYKAHPKLVKSTLEKADAVVVLSDSWRNFFENEIGAKNVNIISNIISSPLPQPTAHKGVTQALFLGLIGDRKGIFDLLEALRRNKHSLEGRFVLNVGGNGDVKKFQSKVKAYGLDAMVKFHGWTSGSDKTRLLNESDIFILPSYAEGLPISILEAMSYGCAIISTPVGGIPEVVQNDNGILVEPGDVNAIGDAVCRLVAAPSLIKSMGCASMSKVAPHLPENVAEELTMLYKNMLK